MEIASNTVQLIPAPTRDEAALRAAARALEAGFLAEMLKGAGLGKVPEAFGGGAGEEQFASFLVQAQAEQMVRRGGIGLAEMLFDSLVERRDDRV
ncbi:rod-binding protein [Plastorhodobacter daqingensis]|uniref:Rod-binding protein n=1 Tax=Plastorhodobacter daqingensis TaxID=1387281 RepID=A0ABW2UGL7_9RHOB